jgi:hypothetical protein
VGLASFKFSLSKRVLINVCAPVVLTFFVVVLPGLLDRQKEEFIWRLMAIVPSIFCGILSAFLSAIPISLLSKYKSKKLSQSDGPTSPPR